MTTDAASSAEAAARWREQLAAWAIPPAILERAPESPYTFPVGRFLADPAPRDSPSRQLALAALPPAGTVLDVGCGGGQAGLALVPPAARLVGVDSSAGMLAAFAEAAGARGVEHREVHGSWPAAAGEAGRADVVVAHHVAYNVPDLVGFAQALTSAARRRVVVELTHAHPWAATRGLWRRFHGLDRPAGPTAELAADVLREAGFAVRVQHWTGPGRTADRADTVAFVRRRLCLAATADPAVAAALPADYELSGRRLATLWWDAPAGPAAPRPATPTPRP